MSGFAQRRGSRGAAFPPSSEQQSSSAHSLGEGVSGAGLLNTPESLNLVNRLDVQKVPLENLVHDFGSLAECFHTFFQTNFVLPKKVEICLNLPDGSVVNVGIDPPRPRMALRAQLRGGFLLEDFDGGVLPETILKSRGFLTLEELTVDGQCLFGNAAVVARDKNAASSVVPGGRKFVFMSFGHARIKIE